MKTNSSSLVDKSLLVAAKFCAKPGRHGGLPYVHIDKDMIYATDSYVLYTEQRDQTFISSDFPLNNIKAKAIDKFPVLIKGAEILKEQKFFSRQSIPLLNHAYLYRTKGKPDFVNILTTDLEVQNVNSYREFQGGNSMETIKKFTKEAVKKRNKKKEYMTITLDPAFLIKALRPFQKESGVEISIPLTYKKTYSKDPLVIEDQTFFKKDKPKRQVFVMMHVPSKKN